MENCPWPASTQLPVHYCEDNLCAFVVQPANTWSNIGYFIVALVLLRQSQLNQNKYWFAFLSLMLFIGSTLYHMTGTYWGRDLDVGAMLMLSGFMLSLTITRFFDLKNIYTLLIAGVVLSFSLPNIGRGTHLSGGTIFVIQCVTCALVEWATARRLQITKEQKSWLLWAFGLFIFALVLNLLDMKRIYCLPANPVITLHAIWHLICAYCIFLISKYYSTTNPRSPIAGP